MAGLVHRGGRRWRARLACGAALSVLAVAVLGVWFMSLLRWVGFAASTWEVEVHGGLLTVNRASAMARSGWWCERPPSGGGLSVLPHAVGRGTDLNLRVLVHTVDVSEWGRWETWQASLWAPALLGGCVGTLLVRSGVITWRRSRTGRCVVCGYDRAGISKETPCPECGAERS